MNKTGIRRGFGWKRSPNIAKPGEKEIRLLKYIEHRYPEMKKYCRMFETKRKSIFVMAKLAKGTTFRNPEKVRELMGLPLAEQDKGALYAYFDIGTKLMVFETGMEALPEGMYREIAHGRYYGRRSYQELMETYGVDHKTIQRALRRTNEFLAESVKTYFQLAEKCPF